jgi:hypothetical protein
MNRLIGLQDTPSPEGALVENFRKLRV